MRWNAFFGGHRLRQAAKLLVVVKRAIIEAIVVAAVDAVLAGRTVEDERVECKSELFSLDKARQLAGAANAALGEDIIWIVGVNESTKKLVPGDPNVDVDEWWSKVSRAFEGGVTPDLTSVRVPVAGGDVLALHFRTDRAPYLVKNPKGGNPEFEVPWREGTGTRSAKRHDLLRILLPATRVPSTAVLSCNGLLQALIEALSIHAEIRLFLEHTAGPVCVLPTHLMSASLQVAEREYAVKLGPVPAASGTLDYGGVDVVRDGIYCRQPGIVLLEVSGEFGEIVPDTPTMLQNLDSVILKIQLGIAGTSGVVSHRIHLNSKFDKSIGPTARVELELESTPAEV